jgi:polyisoprenyl-teichoic acid--peptidoglycan teichoic acid transferase
MLSRRHTALARALAVTLALALSSLVLLPHTASANPSDGNRPPAQSTPTAPYSLNQPGNFAGLPALFPAWEAEPTPPSGPPSIHSTENILVLGMDAREGGKMWRTDTIMVAAVDSARQRVGLLSIPRDLWVDIPGYGEGRINIVDFIGESREGRGGGPASVSKVLNDKLGIQTKHWVRIRQEGLVDLVDAMGGITITLDCPFIEKTPDPKVKGQFEYLMLPAGLTFLQGETAKKFVTYRYASTDFNRARRQQQIIWAIRDRALEIDVISRIPQLWTALADTFQTDLLLGDLVELAMLGRDLGRENVVGMVISRDNLKSAVINGSAVLVVGDPALLKQEVEKLFESRPIAELGRSATGRCASGVPAATNP